MSESDTPQEAGADRTDTPHESDDAAAQNAEIDRLTGELARTTDRYRRALADLDNYRKRTAGEGERRAREASRRTVTDWLEAVDAVDRALLAQPEDAGLRAVRSQMEGILRRQGWLTTDPVGVLFDPVRHEAIEVRTDAGAPDRTVLEVARAGFESADREDVLRPTQVVVSRRPAGEAGEA